MKLSEHVREAKRIHKNLPPHLLDDIADDIARLEAELMQAEAELEQSRQREARLRKQLSGINEASKLGLPLLYLWWNRKAIQEALKEE